MYIRPPRTRKLRTEPVLFGRGSGGKRKLVQAVMEAGYPFRVAEKAVNAVIAMWKTALIKHKLVAAPLGVLKVIKTPRNLYKKRYTVRREGRLYTWTIYNDRFRIRWKAEPDKWEELLRAVE